MATRINIGRPAQTERTNVSTETEIGIPWRRAWGAFVKGGLRILCYYSAAILVWRQLWGIRGLYTLSADWWQLTRNESFLYVFLTFVSEWWAGLCVPFPMWGVKVWGNAIRGDMPQLVNNLWPPPFAPVRLAEIVHDFRDRSETWIGKVLAWRASRSGSLVTPDTVFASRGEQVIEDDYEHRAVSYTAKGKVKEGRTTVYAEFEIPNPEDWHGFCKRLIGDREHGKTPRFSARGAKKHHINSDQFAAIRDEFCRRELATWRGGNTRVNLKARGWAMIKAFATTPPLPEPRV